MPKNIVFCADGTWNGPGEADHDDQNAPATNVFKLFLDLAGTDTPNNFAKERERSLTAPNGNIEQVAKYINGVGDSQNFLVKILGGGFGVGLITRIVRGYTFVSRNYEFGDKIYLIGFSRGAYTSRALAGLISAKGLLPPNLADPSDKEGAYRAGSAVWYAWRQERLIAQGHPLDHIQEIAFDLPHFLHQPPSPAAMVPAPIEVVAVWDTVGALGIPTFNAQHVAIDVFQFADTALSENVKFGRHAISIDERRSDFPPTLWDPNPRIVQVLFPGAHADIGGGYPTSNNESGLSDITRRWMCSQLKRLGLFFLQTPTIAFDPDPKGTAHRPWEQPLWANLPLASRSFRLGLGLSQSVIDRMNAGPVMPDPSGAAMPYRPDNIPLYLAGMTASANVQVFNGAQDWP
jgi:hypothetical protein